MSTTIDFSPVPLTRCSFTLLPETELAERYLVRCLPTVITDNGGLALTDNGPCWLSPQDTSVTLAGPFAAIDIRTPFDSSSVPCPLLNGEITNEVRFQPTRSVFHIPARTDRAYPYSAVRLNAPGSDAELQAMRNATVLPMQYKTVASSDGSPGAIMKVQGAPIGHAVVHTSRTEDHFDVLADIQFPTSPTVHPEVWRTLALVLPCSATRPETETSDVAQTAPQSVRDGLAASTRSTVRRLAGRADERSSGIVKSSKTRRRRLQR